MMPSNNLQVKPEQRIQSLFDEQFVYIWFLSNIFLIVTSVIMQITWLTDFLALLFVVALCCWVIKDSIRILGSLKSLSATIYFLVFLLGYTALVHQAPGWDGVDFWLEPLNLSNSPIENLSTILHGHRHSFVLPALWTSISHATDFLPFNAVGLIFSALGLVTFTALSMTMEGERGRLAAFLTLIAYASMPLWLMHQVLVGYSEILVSLLMIMIARTLSSRSACPLPAVVILILATSLLLLVRNTGPLYALIIYIPVLIGYLHKRSTAGKIAVLITIFFTAICLFDEVVNLNFGSGSRSIIFEVLGWKLKTDTPSLGLIFESVAYSLYFNQSFGVIPCVYTIVLAEAILKQRVKYIDFSILIGLAIYVAMFFTERGQQIASAGSDTYGSRFLLPLCVLMILRIYSWVLRRAVQCRAKYD